MSLISSVKGLFTVPKKQKEEKHHCIEYEHNDQHHTEPYLDKWTNLLCTKSQQLESHGRADRQTGKQTKYILFIQ